MQLDKKSEAVQSERDMEQHGEESEGQLNRVAAAEDIRYRARAKNSGHNLEGLGNDLGEKHCGPCQIKLSQFPQHWIEKEIF